jgi:hypothetical protein
MSKLNIVLGLNGYEDITPSNNPAMNSFKWDRAIQGLDIQEPNSRKLIIPANQVVDVFSGNIAISADNTTTWNIALKSGTSNTYRVSHSGGTLPEFRVSRSSGADTTTQVQVTKNGKVLTFTSIAGTLFDLIAGGVQVGDEVRIGSGFASNNQGVYSIISVSATSFSVVNQVGSAETVTLGVSFADQVKIYSVDGVQKGDKIQLLNGFSPASLGTYEITDVADTYVEFFSLDGLPAETNVSNSPAAFTISREAKKFLFVESDGKLEITIDETATPQIIEPMFSGKDKQQGFFLYTGSMKSISIKNLATTAINVFFVTAE